ncbi:MAG TPA: MerR family transcriptional regulator [Acidimicrobiales bacterium]|nr:MerR family transcriptional regulator [Acidimicrobiales bacterium]
MTPCSDASGGRQAIGSPTEALGAAGWPSAPAAPSSSLTFDDWHAPVYTVGQVASALGVQPAFLRRLDSEAVVTPARSDGGQRRYSRVEIDRIAKVVAMASEGLTLAGIRRLIALEHEVAGLRRELAEERARRGAAQAPPSP